MPPDVGSAPSKTHLLSDGTRTGSDVLQQEDAAGIRVLAVNLDTILADISTALSNRLMLDGGNQPSTDIPLNSKKFTGVADATGRTNYASAGQVQDSSILYAGTSSGTNTITATLTPAITSYQAGQRYTLKAGGTCAAGATTLNINGVSAASVKKGAAGATDPEAGDITLGGIYDFEFDGTNFQLLNPQATQTGGFGTQTNIASATTTDLGTVGSHNVQITGTTTITSFGSSASLLAPVYLVKFGGVITVTHSATLVLPGLVSYTAAAGDCMLVELVASGDWRVREIMPRTPIGGLTDNADPDQTLSQIAIRNSSTGAVERATLSTLIAYEHIQSQTASASAQLDFALPTAEAFTHFEFMFSGIVPGTDASDLYMRFSTDGGSTYNAGASDYAYGLALAGNPATAELAANNATAIHVYDALGTAAGEFVSGRVRLFDPFNASIRKFVEIALQGFSANTTEMQNLTGGGGFRANSAALTHVRFIMSAGTLASGTISMYGIRAS